MANDVTIHVKSKDDTDLGKLGASVTAKTEREFGKAGDRSSRSFGSSVKKWFTGEGGGLFTEIGKSGGTVFGSGLLGALKTPILGPILTAGFAGAVATVMPAIGAVAAGGLITGLGAGLAGLGLVFAAKSKPVQDEWSRTLTAMGKDMQLLSRPFEDTLTDIAGTFRETFDAFEPYLSTAFEDMAKPVEFFVDDVGEALQGLIPAVEPVTGAFNKVLAVLGPALQDSVGSVSDGLVRLADSVKESPNALADVATGLGDISQDALGLIATLNDLNGEFEDLTGGLSLIDVSILPVRGSLALLDATFAGLKLGLEGLNKVADSGADKVESMGVGFGAAAEQILRTNVGVTAAGTAINQTSAAAQGASPAIANLVRQFQLEDAAVNTLIASMFRLSGLSLGLSNAQIGLQAAIDNATAAAKDNGRTLDLNTEKGRANRTALNNLATAANQQTQAMQHASKSNTDVARTVETSRAKFIALARQMGLSKTEAQRLANQLIAIPNVSREAKLTANKKDLELKLAAAKRELDNPKLTATKRAQITANIKSLQAQLAAAQRAIDALRGKTVTVTTRHVEERIIRTQSGATGGRPPTHAHGGMARGTFIAGEAGPEVVRLMGGRAQVTPAGNTRRQLSGLLGNLVGTEFTGSTQQLRQMRQLGSWWPARQRQLALARERAADQRRLTAERQELAGRRSAELARLAVQRRAHLVHEPSTVGSTQQPIRISFDASSSDPLGRAVMEWLRKQIKIEGGDVSVVLGSRR